MFKTHPDTGAMDSKLDNLTEQPGVANRFAQIMQTHVTHYQPPKK